MLSFPTRFFAPPSFWVVVCSLWFHLIPLSSIEITKNKLCELCVHTLWYSELCLAFDFLFVYAPANKSNAKMTKNKSIRYFRSKLMALKHHGIWVHFMRLLFFPIAIREKSGNKMVFFKSLANFTFDEYFFLFCPTKYKLNFISGEKKKKKHFHLMCNSMRLSITLHWCSHTSAYASS